MTPETVHPERCVLRKLRMIEAVVMNSGNVGNQIFRSLKRGIRFVAPAVTAEALPVPGLDGLGLLSLSFLPAFGTFGTVTGARLRRR